MINPWKILGVHRGMAMEDIANKYRAIMRKEHPDAGGNAEAAAQAAQAWKILCNAATLKAYMAELAVVGKPCMGCQGRGYQYKQKTLTTRTMFQCVGCGGRGVVTKEG